MGAKPMMDISDSEITYVSSSPLSSPMAALATPERRATSEERHATPSLSGSRSMQNAASPSSFRQHTPSQLTLEAALGAANNNAIVALENVLTERNMLASQNYQLWKLVEKQRAVHGNAMKELERVRADRDRAVAKLDSEHSSRRSYAPKTSISSAMNVNAGIPVPESPEVKGKDDDASLSTPRPSTPPISTSKSHEPLRPSNQNPLKPSVAGNAPEPTVNDEQSRMGPVSASISSHPRADSLPGNSLPGSSNATSTASMQPPDPNTVQKQHSASLPLPSNNAMAKRQSSLPLPASQKPPVPLPSLSVSFDQSRTLNRESRVPLPDEARRYIASMQDSPLASPSREQVPSSGKPNGMIVEEPAVMSEESTRAPESKGLGIYDPNHVSTRPAPLSSGPNGINPGPSLKPPTIVEEDKPTAFLDLTDDDEEEPDSADSRFRDPENTTPQKSSSIPAPGMRDNSSLSHQQQDQPSTAMRMETNHPRPNDIYPQPKVITSVFDASSTSRGPPSSEIEARSSTGAHSSDTLHPMPQVMSTQPVASPTVRIQAPTFAQAQVQAQRIAHFQAQQQIMAQSHGHQPPSYQNPRFTLLESDLQRCLVRVIGSNIRANERGKEVLSFVIGVAPSRKSDDGDNIWKVEKLYSDILALDARVRSQLTRGSVKKLGSLPDNKLFKDHAPAKVDQRKAMLENYLMTVVRAPLKDGRDVCEFFSSDFINEASAPVMQSGYKEGYLTKRGKNFGGWKTRYFVLHGPVLEYYENRGGTHLGSIHITGAQIGRQQKSATHTSSEDENEYRHAFLIIENKKGAGGQHTRHVLCAESDQERDSWVDVLVRYVMGTYDDNTYSPPHPSMAANPSYAPQAIQPRPSISSQLSVDVTPTKRTTRADISKGSAVPISQLVQDPSNAKLFQSAPMPDTSPSSSSASPLDRYPSPLAGDRNLQHVAEVPLSSSLPTHLDVGGQGGLLSQRATSELGHYPDLKDSRSQAAALDPSKAGQRMNVRSSLHPSLSTVHSSPTFPTSNNPITQERGPSPDPSSSLSPDSTGKVKISGPLNGTPIPAGYKFGAKDAPAESNGNSDRAGKAKSRNFWGFGRGSSDKAPGGTAAPRAVFAVPIADALSVAQIANLPAVVFRCIQYLEAKKADQEEGIYRLSGSSAVIKSLKDRFNAEGDVDLLASDEFWDPHAIAGLLKSFLRELPTSILTRDLHLKFLAVMDLADQQERVAELAQLISQLPLPNYSLLRALTAHLILIVKNASVNKMTMRNVGIVFSPTLGIPAGVFSLMLGEFNRVFNVDAEEFETEVATPGAAEAERAPVADNRNSRSYADADADRMLGIAGRSLEPRDEEYDDADEITLPDSTSGAETEEADATTTLDATSGENMGKGSVNEHQEHVNVSSQGETLSRGGKAANVAATRGLQVATDHGRPAAIPHSPRRGAIPLPHSPRPGGAQNSPALRSSFSSVPNTPR